MISGGQPNVLIVCMDGKAGGCPGRLHFPPAAAWCFLCNQLGVINEGVQAGYDSSQRRLFYSSVHGSRVVIPIANIKGANKTSANDARRSTTESHRRDYPQCVTSRDHR